MTVPFARSRPDSNQAVTSVFARSVVIDNKRFLRIDGIPICRVTENGTLELKDKDGRRSRQRGSAFVEVTLADVQSAIRHDFLEDD